MSEIKVIPPVAATVPFMRSTPEVALRQKKDRDQRRKAIRGQNAASKLLK